jgi:hypothetical protein
MQRHRGEKFRLYQDLLRDGLRVRAEKPEAVQLRER